jgi:hypothetical protein
MRRTPPSAAPDYSIRVQANRGKQAAMRKPTGGMPAAYERRDSELKSGRDKGICDWRVTIED